MESLKENPALASFSRQLLKALRAIVLPHTKRLRNHDHHIQYLLATVKELKRDRDAQADTIKRLRDRAERDDSE